MSTLLDAVLTLWHWMLKLIGIDWVPTRSVVEMLTTFDQFFGSFPRCINLFGALLVLSYYGLKRNIIRKVFMID